MSKNFTRFMMFVLLILFMVAVIRLVSEGEWFFAGSLLWGAFQARDGLSDIFEEGGDDDQSTEDSD